MKKESLIDRLRYWYWDKVPYSYRPSQLYYAAKCFLWNRYSTVKPRYLPHTWVDRDHLLLHTSFEILSDYVENEMDQIEWYGDYAHKVMVDGVEKYVGDELKELYNWWNQTYQIEYKQREEAIWVKIEGLGKADFMRKKEGCEFFELGPFYEGDETGEKTALHSSYMDEINALEVEVDNKEQEMLHRLINIRRSLWS